MQEDTSLEKPWYLAQLKPNGLALALRNLERQKFIVFAPTEQRTQRRAGKFITKPAPVFPGYVFVQIGEDSCGIRAINSTRGITRLVALGPEPAIVPRDVMAALFARFAVKEAPDRPLPFQPADRVGIQNGPFADLVARIEATAPNDRGIVLLEIMGRPLRVTLGTSQIRKLHA